MEMGVQRGPGGDPQDPSLTPENFLGTSLDELGWEGGGGIEGGGDGEESRPLGPAWSRWEGQAPPQPCVSPPPLSPSVLLSSLFPPPGLRDEGNADGDGERVTVVI